MIQNRLPVLLLAVLLLLSCEKQRVAPQSADNPVRQQSDSTSDSYGIEASSRLVTTEELSKLSPYQLKILKNGIYARHGFTFKSQEMIDYFEKQEWYEPDPTYSDSRLSVIERQNIVLISYMEKGPSAAGTAEDRKALITTWGTQLAARHDGRLTTTEYELFDIDGDADKDAVAIFLHTVGGNSGAYYCRLAVFENRDGVYVHRADSRAGDGGEATISRVVSAAKGIITCETSVWLPDDPNCCASGTGSAVFQLTGDRLEQIRGEALPGTEQEWSGE